MPGEFVVELYKRNSVLAVLGWYCAGLFLAMMALIVLDDRVVQGVSSWIKPSIIVLSMGVYAWTLAWFSRYAAKPLWRIRTFSVVIAGAVVVETSCLVVQAARGTSAYFNSLTDFDAMVSSLMGWMMAVNLLMMFFILALIRQPTKDIHPTYLWGIRFGFIVFFFGAWIGNEMLANGSHAVGAASGGAGLAILNWSTQAGDLRVAHALGLHSLQILPILGYGISTWREVSNDTGKLFLISAVAAGYAYLVFALYQQAMLGLPFIAI
jgi:hypothetical protein